MLTGNLFMEESYPCILCLYTCDVAKPLIQTSFVVKFQRCKKYWSGIEVLEPCQSALEHLVYLYPWNTDRMI